MNQKAKICSFFAMATNVPGEKNKLHFVTPAGIISGELASGYDEDAAADYHVEMVKQSCRNTMDDGVVVLRQAVLHQNGCNTYIGAMVVFLDSVISVFVGSGIG